MYREIMVEGFIDILEEYKTPAIFVESLTMDCINEFHNVYGELES